jgi:hypothetical protein
VVPGTDTVTQTGTQAQPAVGVEAGRVDAGQTGVPAPGGEAGGGLTPETRARVDTLDGQIDRLNATIAALPADAPTRATQEDQLAKLRAERDRLAGTPSPSLAVAAERQTPAEKEAVQRAAAGVSETATDAPTHPPTPELDARIAKAQAALDSTPRTDAMHWTHLRDLTRLEQSREQARAIGRGEAVDPALALNPDQQARVNKLNKQITPLDERVRALGDLETRTPVQEREFAARQDQLAKLRRARDALVGQPDAEKIASRFWRPKPKPFVPPKEPTGEKTFGDYQFQNGASVYTKAFADAGYDPRLATSLPLKKQIDILTRQMGDQFGFRTVKIAADHPGGYTVMNQMLNTYRAMHDMMASLKLPLDQASLGGRLALHIEPMREAKKGGGYFGMYDPNTHSLHLADGANSFAHEWVHALDHQLTTIMGTDPHMEHMFSTFTRVRGLDPKDDVNARFAKLLNTIFYDEGALAQRKMQLDLDAQKVDAKGKPTRAALDAQERLRAIESGADSKAHIKSSEYRKMAESIPDPYWRSERELLARAGEAWVARQMEVNGVNPRGVAMPDEAYARGLARRLRVTFPKNDERVAIHQAFSDLFEALRAQQIFGSPEAALSHDYGLSDPAGYMRAARLAGGAPATRSLAVRFMDVGNNFRKLQSSMRENAIYDRARPVSSRPWSKRTALTIGHIFNAKLTDFDSIIKANNPAVQRVLQKLRDKFGTPHGSDHYAGGEGFEQASRAQKTKWDNRLAALLERNGLLEKMTDLESAMIHHGLTTGQGTYQGQTIPANVRAAIGDIRLLHNQVFDAAKGAKLDIEYIAQHFPRFYDQAKITANQANRAGFVRDAHRLYRFMFDKEVGAPGDNPDALLKRYRQMPKAEKGVIEGNNPGVNAGMKRLGKNLAEQRRIEEQLRQGAPNAAGLQARLATLQAEAEQLAQTHHDAIGDHVAGVASNDWYARVQMGYPGDFEKIGPSGRFLNHRSLPPEADQIMKNWMQTDIRTALPDYYKQVARKVAYAERLGAKGEFIEEQLRQAVDAGLHQQDANYIRGIIQQITGYGENGNSTHRRLSPVMNGLNAYGATMLMPRSMWTSLHEFAVPGLVTGDVRVAMKAFGNLVGGILKTEDAHGRAELADLVGVTNSKLAESLWTSRVGDDYSDTPKIAHFMQRFYRMIGLNALTTAIRRANFGALDWHLGQVSRHLLSTEQGPIWDLRRDRARRLFNELGISPQMHDQFAQWKAAQDGMPEFSDLADPTNGNAVLYGRAMRTLSDWSSQSPYKGDVPAAVENPWGRMIFQLQHYNYAFMRNVLDPAVANMERDYKFMRDRAAGQGAGWLSQRMHGIGGLAYSGAGFASAAGGLLMSSLATSMIREALFNGDKWDEHKEKGDFGDWLQGLAMQRSGLTGTLDPIVQLVNNLRYNADLATLTSGASISFIGNQVVDLLRATANAFDPEAPETNTKAHDATKSFYNLFGIPAMAYMANGVTLAGVPLVSPAASFAFQKLTTAQTANRFADVVTGKKGTKLPAPEPEGALGPSKAELSGGDDLELGPSAEELSGTPSDKEKTGGIVGGSVPWGLLDDFIAPGWKVMQPALGSLPGPLKLGAVGAAGVAAAGKFLSNMAPYRNAPPPAKKAAP